MTISEAKGKANNAKHELIDLYDSLLNSGHIKDAELLEKIIIKLEVWQNK